MSNMYTINIVSDCVTYNGKMKNAEVWEDNGGNIHFFVMDTVGCCTAPICEWVHSCGDEYYASEDWVGMLVQGWDSCGCEGVCTDEYDVAESYEHMTALMADTYLISQDNPMGLTFKGNKYFALCVAEGTPEYASAVAEALEDVN